MKTVPKQWLSIALSGLAACASAPAEEAPPEARWLEPSPVLDRQLEDQIERLPWSQGPAKVEIILWLASVGEPAYPRLLELCTDPRVDVAVSALAALGATQDARLPDHVNALDWPEVLPEQVRFERARTLLRLGDWSQIRVLVNGLESEDLWTRSWCARALEESTRQTLGFDPHAEEAERVEGVKRWQEWVDSREVEGILITG